MAWLQQLLLQRLEPACLGYLGVLVEPHLESGVTPKPLSPMQAMETLACQHMDSPLPHA